MSQEGPKKPLERWIEELTPVARRQAKIARLRRVLMIGNCVAYFTLPIALVLAAGEDRALMLGAFAAAAPTLIGIRVLQGHLLQIWGWGHQVRWMGFWYPLLPLVPLVFVMLPLVVSRTEASVAVGVPMGAVSLALMASVVLLAPRQESDRLRRVVLPCLATLAGRAEEGVEARLELDMGSPFSNHHRVPGEQDRWRQVYATLEIEAGARLRWELAAVGSVFEVEGSSYTIGLERRYTFGYRGHRTRDHLDLRWWFPAQECGASPYHKVRLEGPDGVTWEDEVPEATSSPCAVFDIAREGEWRRASVSWETRTRKPEAAVDLVPALEEAAEHLMARVGRATPRGIEPRRHWI